MKPEIKELLDLFLESKPVYEKELGSEISEEFLTKVLIKIKTGETDFRMHIREAGYYNDKHYGKCKADN